MRVGLAAVACCLLILAGCSSGSSSGGSASTGSSGGSTLKAPTAQPGGTYAGTVGAPLTFNGSGSTDPQNQTLSYAWNFGDNATSAGPDPTHTYTATGIFTVTLTVTDTGGLSGTATTQASIGQPGPVGLTGTVSNGVLPIVGAHVYLFAANTTGYGQASISLLTAAKTGTSDAVGAYVLSSASGGFSMTGDYSCTSGQQLYLYALGGTAGGNTNLNAGLLAAIGNCTGAGSVVYAVVNEVSTVAAAYAIAGFAVDATHVSSSGTALAQAGIASAFANAANLATLSTGIALPTAPGSNATVPRLEINALANILGSCVVTGTSCNTLLPLAANGGTIPTDTATAAIDIAHNPGANTATLFGLGASQVFTPALSGAPNDFTLALVYSDYNLAYGYSLAIDGAGNAWTANGSGSTITEFSSSGISQFSGSGLDEDLGIAIDSSGDVWTANFKGNNVVEMTATGSALSGAAGYTGGGLGNPEGIAIDGLGNAWIANATSNSVTKLSSSGTVLSGATGYTGGLSESEGIAIDGSGNAWVTNFQGNSVTKLSSAGALAGTFTGGGLGAPYSIAIDGSGSAWIANTSSNSVTKLSSTGAPLSGASGYTGGGLGEPFGIAIDGAGDAWVANQTTNCVTEISSSGALLSGASGYQNSGMYGPWAVAIDGSGNVWVSNSSGDNVFELVGAAAPVVTPLATAVKNNALGTRP